MSNLITSGLTNALLSANSAAKLSTQPMMQASRELKKANPDMGLVENGLKYGGEEMSKAKDATKKAALELEEAQEIASAVEKAELAARLEEKTSDSSVNKTDKVATEEIIISDETNNETVNADGSISKPPKVDTVEISADALQHLANSTVKTAIVDIPKVYTPTSVVNVPVVPVQPQLDVRA